MHCENVGFRRLDGAWKEEPQPLLLTKRQQSELGRELGALLELMGMNRPLFLCSSPGTAGPRAVCSPCVRRSCPLLSRTEKHTRHYEESQRCAPLLRSRVTRDLLFDTWTLRRR